MIQVTSNPGAVPYKGVAAPVLPPVAPTVIKRGSGRRKVIALTFDACWKNKPSRYDAKIIRILRETHTPATLLLGGRWMEAFPAQTRALAQDPLFEVGNHSYSHPHMTRISEAEARGEIKRTQDVLFGIAGRQGTLFRPPYGEYDQKLARIAASLGMKTLLWSIETGDPDPNTTAAEMIREVTRRARPGSIVIMHMNGRGWHSAEALPTLIQRLRAAGYEFVKVPEL
jgi:peptidoglycan/xylan/chitin deacetylase (PgdA/CDA1 family)